MAIVGYLEGTDPAMLTHLTLHGAETTPLGNGFDGHGKYIGHLTKNDGIAVVVGYLHKILPTAVHKVSPSDFLNACNVNDIPVFLIAPSQHHDLAREMLGGAADWITLVDPEDIFQTVKRQVTG